jgi:hypothetical protein
MAQQAKRRTNYMSALPTPRPELKRKLSKKQAARAIARMLEEHMEEMGLSEADKNERVRLLGEDVKRLKASRASNPSR